ncbi:MAG TPA: hypothetical protein VJ878_04960 [Candidatus Izemoplasmatales bacterium]|nr:hypothetical protein [Candidatus Izemoplasmatales bacterium]
MKKYILVILIILTTIPLLACTDTSTKDYDYNDFNYLQVSSYEDQLYYLDGTYYIYYYSEQCAGCHHIKQDVLNKISSLDKDTVLLFDVSLNYYRGINIEPSFNLEYTPSIVKVYDNKHVATYDNYQNAGLVLSVFDRLE